MNESVWKRLITSAKVWTVIVGSIVTGGAAMFAKWGLDVSDATVQQIAGTIALLVGVLVHAQGQADLGKNAISPIVFDPGTTSGKGGGIITDIVASSPPITTPDKGTVTGDGGGME